MSSMWSKPTRMTPLCALVGASLMVSVAAGASGDEAFVRSNCASLGHGIHQKVENYRTKDGFTDIVLFSLFCGVELQAHGQRELRGSYTQEVGYEVVRHWGYLKYTPTPESWKRAAVEAGRWKVGRWKTRARGLNNLVILDEGPEIVNGSWNYCTEDARHLCREE